MTRSLSDLGPGSAEDRPSCPRVFACGPLVIGEVLGTFGRGAERTDLHLTGIVRVIRSDCVRGGGRSNCGCLCRTALGI